MGIPESTVAQKLYTSIVTVAIIIALSFVEKLLAQLHNIIIVGALVHLWRRIYLHVGSGALNSPLCPAMWSCI